MNNGNVTLKNCNNVVKENRISLVALLFAVYVALTPIHQALLTSSGGTVTKYLVVLIIGVMMLGYKNICFEKKIVNIVLVFAVWIGLTAIWSSNRSGTISSFITIYSHLIMFLMCSTYPFTAREKRLIRYSLIIASLIYAVLLINGMLSGEELRATISVGMNDKSSDQNLLSVNIGVAVLFAFDNFKKESKTWLKVFNIVSIIIIQIGMYSTGSRGGIIATLVAFIYLLFKLYPGFTFKKVMWIVFILVFTFYILSDNSILTEYIINRYNNADSLSGNSGRSDIWLQYFKMLIENPYMILIGGGYGVESSSYSIFYGTRWPPATHNDYVSLLTSTGLFGLFAIGKLVHFCWNKSKINDNYLTKACIILSLIAAMSLNTFSRYGFWNILIFAVINI